jgi:hypothetical protein
MNTNAQCRCAVCRARKSRCIVRHSGACERCVEKGEECDLEVSRDPQSPAISSTASVNGQHMNRSSPRSGHKEKYADTPSSLQITQVRVLGRSAEGNLPLTTLSAAEAILETRPTGTNPDCRARSSVEKSPIPSEESEGAILIVEDLGRTRKFRLYWRQVLEAMYSLSYRIYRPPFQRKLSSLRPGSLARYHSKESYGSDGPKFLSMLDVHKCFTANTLLNSVIGNSPRCQATACSKQRIY